MRNKLLQFSLMMVIGGALVIYMGIHAGDSSIVAGGIAMEVAGIPAFIISTKE